MAVRRGTAHVVLVGPWLAPRCNHCWESLQIAQARSLLCIRGMNRQRASTLALLSLFTVVAACGSETEEQQPAADAGISDTSPRATWHQDVAPIIHDKCVTCHQSDGGIAPFGLETFDEASPLAGFMLQQVESGAMPPWSARSSEECSPAHDWKDDARLSEQELQVLDLWVEDGAQAGDAATAAPLPLREIPTLEGVTHELVMPAYTTSGFEDELRCFVLDPELTSVAYMTGVEVVPSNLEVAHHATLTVVPAASAQAVRDLEQGDTGFRCTGGVGIPGSYSLGVWVPGTDPFETPAATGTPVGPGAIVVLQMHYHPTGFDHAPDETRVKLRMTDEAPAQTFLFTAIGNANQAPALLPGENDGDVPQFRIPANIDDHRESMAITIDAPGLEGKRLPIVAITPHMHYVGQHMQVSIERAAPLEGESNEECLVNVQDWDFDWQRTYNYNAELEALPTVTDGDTITLKCDYNNTLSNPFVERMLAEEGLENPIDVFLGEETTDEMCIAILGVVF